MTDTGLSVRRTIALHALAQRSTTRPGRFPGETRPNDGLPDDPDQTARIFNARYYGLPTPEEPTR